MAFASPYVLRETGGNLARNIVMTVAAIVTMAVSLTALGGVLIMRQAINMPPSSTRAASRSTSS